MLLYYITDRRQFPGNEVEKRKRLLAKIAEAGRAGVDFIQLREKDLSGRELEHLARDAVALIARETRNAKREARLLINSRTDIAFAAGADGVHLTSTDISAGDARALWDIAARNMQRQTRNVIIGVSCHTIEEVRLAESHGADFAVFGPVFEKAGQAPTGIENLRRACSRIIFRDGQTEAGNSGTMPVLALGGVTLANARACMEAGAAGIAAIRLFQEHEISIVIGALRTSNAHVGQAPSPAGHAKMEVQSHTHVGQAPSPAGRSQPKAAAAGPRAPYRRRLPHLQRNSKLVFVTFRTANHLQLNESARDVVLQHCLHDNGSKFVVYACVVMPDHVHMLFAPLIEGSRLVSLAEILQRIKGSSAHTVNRLLHRSGPVWQDESFDHVLRSSEDLNSTIAYIENNPVRKGLVSRPEDYKWTWRRPAY